MEQPLNHSFPIKMVATCRMHKGTVLQHLNVVNKPCRQADSKPTLSPSIVALFIPLFQGSNRLLEPAIERFANRGLSVGLSIQSPANHPSDSRLGISGVAVEGIALSRF